MIPLGSLPNRYFRASFLAVLTVGQALPVVAQSSNLINHHPSNQPALTCPSAVSVPGDKHFGNELAHEFIYCESPECRILGGLGCERQPFLCVPESWCKAKIQEDFQDTKHQRFFLDANTITGGMDIDPADGLEQAELVFYGGHGTPTFIMAWHSKVVKLKTMSLGDWRTRYWWMLSCNVMAHGPNCTIPTAEEPIPKCDVPLGPDSDFLAPEKFDLRDFNVFARWGATVGSADVRRMPLNPNLRMACGGSTLIGGYSSFPTASIWHYKLMTRLPVADSFLLGLGRGYHIPLCITRGRSDREKTPLYDQEFTRDPNPAPDGDHLFIQYPVHLKPPFPALEAALQQRFEFAGPHPLSGAPQVPPPASLPILEVERTPLPSWLNGLPWSNLPALPYGYKGGGADVLFPPVSLFSDSFPPWLKDIFRAEDTCLKVQPRSGATTVTWVPSNLTPPLDEHLLSVQDLSSLLTSIGLEQSQWIGPAPGLQNVKRLRPDIEILRMNVDGAETAKAIVSTFSAKDIDRHKKCLYIRLQPWLRVGETPVRVFGEGGEWLLGGCPGPRSGLGGMPPVDRVCESRRPALLNLSWVGRQIVGAEEGSLRDLKEARKEARRRLGPLWWWWYRRPSYRWGYKAAPVHCTQSRMYVVYLFDFLPRKRGRLPITIEIPAHQLDEGERIDDWECDPAVPPG